MIDNYRKTMALLEAIKTQLPIPATVTGAFRRMMKEKGYKIKADQVFQIKDVVYHGDEGGIVCDITPSADAKEVILTSLTHLRVSPRHPLAEQIRAYQQIRTQKLAMQIDRGPAAFTVDPRRL